MDFFRAGDHQNRHKPPRKSEKQELAFWRLTIHIIGSVAVHGGF
jgi:hypothetical protein